MKSAAAAAMFLLLTAPASAESSPRFNSWHIYWDTDKVRPASEQYGPALTRIGAFGVDFDHDGKLNVEFGSLEETLALLKRNTQDAPVYLTVVNDIAGGKKSKQKDPEVIHEILSSPEKIAEHIDQLVKLASPFDGVEIDFENVRHSDRDAFTRYIQMAAEELHRRDKKLSVVVEPKDHDVVWNGAGASDWAAIAEAADMVEVMAYYDHFPGGPPGPVASTQWVTNIANYAFKTIPKEKITIILLMNGVDWSDKAAGKTIDYESAMKLASEKRAKILREKPSRSPYFRYKEKSERHLVWFEDDESLQEKLKALERMGITNIGLWRLGSGDPKFWARVKKL